MRLDMLVSRTCNTITMTETQVIIFAVSMFFFGMLCMGVIWLMVTKDDGTIELTIKRTVLTAKDYKELVSGNIINKEGIDICLADIGWDKMGEILTQAWADQRLQKDSTE